MWQDGDALTRTVTVGSSCSGCEGFGARVFNGWESYLMAAPTSSSGNYSITVYDDMFCKDDGAATLTTLWGDFPGSLDSSVDSYRICPPGKQP